MRYDSFEVLSFDCYGTLIDWESGLLAALRPWAGRTGARADEEELLAAFARRETEAQKARPGAPYPQILEAVLDAISRERGAPATAAERAAFGASVGDWPPFPDSARALAALGERYRLCILSNVDRASFARSAARLGAAFDYVFTAQDIGAYKPDPRAFRFLADRLAAAGFAKSRVLHVAQSLYHDHEPARAAGFASVWIDRRRGKPGGAAPEARRAFDARFAGLEDFAAAALAG